MKMSHKYRSRAWLALAVQLALSACGSEADKPDVEQAEPDAGGDSDAGQDAGIEDAGKDLLADLTKAHSAKVPPENGALFGAFVQVEAGSAQELRAKEEVVGRRWVIDHKFYGGLQDEWINARTRWDVDNHIIPLITWEPHNMDLDEIVKGTYDSILRTRAQQAKSLGAEFFLRWGHEMNGNWYPWSGAMSGGAAEDAPAKFIAAWRHVHGVFKEEGADNVVWVWCPLVTDVPNETWNHWTNYYPGDEYVDWIGFDSYNWGTASGCCVWQSFMTLTDAIYRDYAGKKPLMLPETSSAEVGGNKAMWINEMHAQLKTTYSEIKAVVWFDIDKETDWRVDSSPETLEAFRDMVQDPWFNPDP
jgi:hypothetical protein